MRLIEVHRRQTEPERDAAAAVVQSLRRGEQVVENALKALLVRSIYCCRLVAVELLAELGEEVDPAGKRVTERTPTPSTRRTIASASRSVGVDMERIMDVVPCDACPDDAGR